MTNWFTVLLQELWNLCSAESSVFTGFVGFPCPYLPGKETPLGTRDIVISKLKDGIINKEIQLHITEQFMSR